MMEKLDYGIAILLAALALGITLFSIAIDQHQEKQEMIKISFLDIDNKIITVFTDEDGIIQRSDDKIWLNRVIIRVQELQPGETLQCYDLHDKVIAPKEFKTIKVE